MLWLGVPEWVELGWVGVVGWAVRSPPSALPHRSPLEPRESLTNGRAAIVHHWYERWAYLRWTLGPEVPGRRPCSCSAGLCGWVGLPMDFIVTSRLRGIWQIRSRRMSSSQFLCELHQPANPAGFQTMCAGGSLELRPMGWDTELRSRRATLGLSDTVLSRKGPSGSTEGGVCSLRAQSGLSPSRP